MLTYKDYLNIYNKDPNHSVLSISVEISLEKTRFLLDMGLLKSNDIPAFMDDAASFGHLEVVKFLHENRTEGCTKNAIIWAASRGHLEVVKFLHFNRTEGCTTHAMDNAAKNGHIEVVKFLRENGY